MLLHEANPLAFVILSEAKNLVPRVPASDWGERQENL
jgi:hypothetical protein